MRGNWKVSKRRICGKYYVYMENMKNFWLFVVLKIVSEYAESIVIGENAERI
jgi:hypothetical protein